ncbi:S1 family peptidase [Vibrio sp. RC27]
MIKRHLLTLVAALCFVNTTTANDLSTYIVNGESTSLTEHPDFASLFFDSIDYDGLYAGPYCGATVLSQTFILTAAHCIFDGDEPNEYSMLFTTVGQTNDASNFPDSVTTVRAKKFYYYSSFSGTDSDLWADDIAIIELESSLNSNATVSTPSDESYRNTSNNFVTIGLGKTDDNDDIDDNTLLSANMTYITNAACQDALFADYSAGYSGLFTNKQICFEGADSSSTTNGLVAGVCSGDSGGPIYYENGGSFTQVGITSFGPSECGSTTVTSYYTEVADYTGWITSVMNGSYDSSTTSVFTATDNKRSAYLSFGFSGGSSGGSDGSFQVISSSSASSGSINTLGLLLMACIALIRRFNIFSCFSKGKGK